MQRVKDVFFAWSLLRRVIVTLAPLVLSGLLYFGVDSQTVHGVEEAVIFLDTGEIPDAMK